MSKLSSTLDPVDPIEHPSTVDPASPSVPYNVPRLNALAASIRESHRGLTAAVFAIGRDLKKDRELLNHGQFGDWLTQEFAWSTSTANRYMQAYTVWGQKEVLVGDLEATGIYLLTAKGTPETVRDEIEAELRQEKRPSLPDIRKRVKAARQAKTGEGPGSDRAARTQTAAAFILDLIVEDLPRLRVLLHGIDAAALVKALLEPSSDAQQPEQVALGLP